jgi:hypothetical protein
MNLVNEANKIVTTVAKKEKRQELALLKKQLKETQKDLEYLAGKLRSHSRSDPKGFWEKAQTLSPEINRLDRVKKELEEKIDNFNSR